MATHDYSRTELFEKYSFYTDNRKQLQEDAKRRVSRWKHAEEVMYRPLPYEDLIDARTDKRWTPSKRQWMEEPGESCWWHGYDDSGQLQIMKHSTSGATLILLHEENYIDVVRYSGYPMMMRYCSNNDRIDRVYQCSFKPTYQYNWEDFHYDQGICVSSVASGGAYERGGEWVDSTWKTTYRYVSDSKGLAEVYRNSELEQNGELRIYKRRGSKAPAKPQAPLLLAYSLKIDSDDAEKLGEAALADAYGFEMNIDHDEPVDKVLFSNPLAVEEVLRGTDLASVPRTAVGITDTAADTDLAELAAQGARWILVDASVSNAPDRARAAADAGLNLLLQIDNKDQVVRALTNFAPKSAEQQLVIATGVSGLLPKRTLNAIRKEVAEGGLGDARIISVVKPEGLSEVNPTPRKLGLDGYLLLDTTFDYAISILDRLASHL